MKNKILISGLIILTGLVLFNLNTSQVYAISDADAGQFQCNLSSYAAGQTFADYQNVCCPTAPGTTPGGEPIDGQQCAAFGKVIRETSDAATAYCADTSSINSIITTVVNNNWKGFNCLRGTVDTTCRTGNYCKNDTGACQIFGGDINNCVASRFRTVKCDSSCGACLPNYVECPIGASVCQLKYIGPNKLYGDTTPNTSTKYDCASRGAEANPCTGVCECPSGSTYSGRVAGQCIAFLDRFKEIFSDGLTWLGGQTWLGHNNSYDYSVTGPTGLKDVYLKTDQSENLNWASSTLPTPLKWLLSNYNLCTVDADCSGAGKKCSEGGLCYTPAAVVGTSCNNDSDCNIIAGLSCDPATKTCYLPSTNLPPRINMTAQLVGLTATAYDGNRGGYSAVNSLCNTAFAGSHVCSSQEIINTYVNNASIVSGLTTASWVNAGVPANTFPLVNDCNGWTTNIPNPYFGTSWNFINKASGILPCDYPKKFACCK